MSGISRRGYLSSVGVGGVVAALAGCVGGDRADRDGGVVSPDEANETVKIGWQADMTGSLSLMGDLHKNIVEPYVSEINDGGGMGGMDVELVVEDTETSNEQGVTAMRRLVQQHEADLVLGSQSSGIAIASIPLAKQMGVPYFTLSRAPSITGVDGNRWTLRPSNVDQYQDTIETVRWGLENVGTKWTSIYQNYAFGQQYNRAVKENLDRHGGELLREIPVPVGETDLVQHLNQVPDDTDVLFHALVPPSSLNFMSTSEELDVSGQRFGSVQTITGVPLGKSGAPDGSLFLGAMPRRYENRKTKSMRHFMELQELDVSDGELLMENWVSYEAISWMKLAIEESGWSSPDDNRALIEWFEQGHSIEDGRMAFPQGDKVFRGEDHQIFTDFYVFEVENGEFSIEQKIEREGPNYEPRADLSSESF